MAAHDLLRSWLVPLLPLREGKLRLVLDGLAEEAWGDIEVAFVLEQIDSFGCIERRAAFSTNVAHAEDCAFPERTQAYLRAWAQNIPRELGDLARRLAHDDEPWWSTNRAPIAFRMLGPARELLDDLDLVTETDFANARRLLVARLKADLYDEVFGAVELEPPLIDWGDLSGTDIIARSQAYERAIVEAGYSDDAYDAYADWLAERDDPRGLVSRAVREGTLMGRRRAEQLERKNEQYLFGPFARDPDFFRGLALHSGFIRRITLLAPIVPSRERPLASMVRALFQLPAACALESVRIRTHDSAEAETCAWLLRDWVRIFESAGPHPTLRRIEIKTGYEGTIEPKYQTEEVAERTAYDVRVGRTKESAHRALDRVAAGVLRTLFPQLEEARIDEHEKRIDELL